MLEKSTYYILDAQGNQLSMYEHFVKDNTAKFYLTERNIYGSSRLGTTNDTLNMFIPEILPSYGILGNRQYELSNQLGNVLSTISDIKYPISDDNTTISGYEVGINGISDYSPFGAPLDGRTMGRLGKYGFNSQERDDEVSGEGNSYTAEFWQYSPRLGRRWEVDPKPNISISNYATFGNNPIMFSDFYGDTIRNRDRQMADNVQNRISNIEKYVSTLEAEYGINKTMNKKYFLKSGGDIAIWNKYKTTNKKLKESTELYKTLDKRAKKTQDIIDNWKESSPNLYALVDEQATDFALSSFTFNSEFDADYGSTTPVRSLKPKSLTIKIADNVNLFTKDIETREFSLNHEAGHFLYIVKFTSEYIKYYDKNIKEGTYVSGGHGATDESGKVATKLGQTQDIPKNGLEILEAGN